MNYFFDKMLSPVGELTLIANERSLVAVLWENDRPGRVRVPPIELSSSSAVINTAKFQLDEYFAGKRRQFNLPLEYEGTKFQQRVWNELRAIPYGQVRSYRDLAEKVGSARAYRAVGTANGRNPLSIVVPCHRVVGADGSLAGFAGGLEAKRFLLSLERRVAGAAS